MIDLEPALTITHGSVFVYHVSDERPASRLNAGMLWPGEPRDWPAGMYAEPSEDALGHEVKLPRDVQATAQASMIWQAKLCLPVEHQVLMFLQDRAGEYRGTREKIADEICVTRVVVKRTLLALERDELIRSVTNARWGSHIFMTKAGTDFLEDMDARVEQGHNKKPRRFIPDQQPDLFGLVAT
jgi:DNA-binding MarR family transcriptional regulator